MNQAAQEKERLQPVTRRGGATPRNPDTPRSLETDVLDILANASRAMGSARVHDQLVDLGYGISEPTVGRLLHQLDRRGQTVRVSNQGRQLTDAGRRLLAQLRSGAEQARLEDMLSAAARPSTIAQLLDVVATRRVLERETARLAALSATETDIQELEQFVAGQDVDHVEPGIHRMIARIAGNRVMEAALALITNDAQLHRKLRAVLRAQGELLDTSFNERIVAAIRSRDGDGAQHAMDEHLSRVIRALERHAERKAD